MGDLLEGLTQAIGLLLSGDAETWRIVLLSLRVSGSALLVGALLGLPLGALLALGHFRGRRALVALIYAGMGMPPVVVGLVVYLLLSRSGPMGWLDWLFTPGAMIVAQAIISLPIVAGLTMAAIEAIDPALRLQLRALGATPTQVTLTMLWEARRGVVVALVAAFGRIISEVGAVMLVGGNIEGTTRVLTTAIVLETRRGAFELAIALGIVLFTVSLVTNALVLQLQHGLARRSTPPG